MKGGKSIFIIDVDIMDKKNIFLKISCILSLLVLVSYISFDLTHYEHREKNYVNNIYDIKISDKDNFVFLGDSITEGYKLDEFYEKFHLVNSGIAGNTTDDILSDMENRVYRYNPTKVFLLIGVNDLGKGKSVEDTYKNILKIISKIKENRSNTKIYIESVYPINDSDDEKIKDINVSNDDINKLNKKIKEHFNDTDVTYIEINESLRDIDDRLRLDYTIDGLHITSLGYLKITKILLPYLKSNS